MVSTELRIAVDDDGRVVSRAGDWVGECFDHVY